MPGQTVVEARSMDLYINDQARLVSFSRGITRTSPDVTDAAVWTSRYGSIVVTGLGIATTDGVNEKGLAANALYLDKSTYEAADSRPAISNAIWAQYVLDNFATVDEALEGLKAVRIVSSNVGGRVWPVHLSIEDASGDSAIIEFVNGSVVIHHGREYNVMSNEPAMDIQLANLKLYKTFGGTLPLPGDIDPQDRFVRASTFAAMLPQATSPIEAIGHVMSVMRTVAVPPGAIDTSGQEDTTDCWETRWIIAADLKNKRYYFQSMTSPNAFWVDLKKIDFSRGTPSSSVNAYDTKLSGDISSRYR